ncbi:MAG TPA: RagB/SusD family nutrient uptake outer membrane protein [Sunxiuqinia sp.]|nr:RagB/SusD family nutrient uptake outer membrane protein [Sunxiuqinia sp.]
MKLIYKLSLIFTVLACFFSSCEDQLTQYPITKRVADNFYSNETDIESAVMGVYAALQSNNLYGLYVPAIGEVPSDNSWEEVPANDGGIFGQLDEFTSIPINGIFGRIWQQSYIGIQRANVVLNRIDAISFTDDAVKKARKGEMQFIRALLYFNMVRIWGDVPLVTKETTNPNDFFGQTRTPVADVYAQIEKDLTDAIANLPEAPSDPGRAVKGSAQTLLGKVYLTQGKYSDAKTQLQAVVNSSLYKLLPNVSDVFSIDNENNEEIIFSVQFASGVNGSSEGSNAFSQFSPSGTVASAKGHDLPTHELYNLYSDQDLRKGVYLDVTDIGTPYLKKLTPNLTNSSDGGSDWVVLRYADVVLMLAEVDNQLNNTSTAIDLLNSIRTRAGLQNTTAASKDDVDKAIQLERRLELVGEGHRWFDLVRRGEAISTMNAYFNSTGKNITIDQHDLLFPVPQTVIDTDPVITQNTGY